MLTTGPSYFSDHIRLWGVLGRAGGWEWGKKTHAHTAATGPASAGIPAAPGEKMLNRDFELCSRGTCGESWETSQFPTGFKT